MWSVVQPGMKRHRPKGPECDIEGPKCDIHARRAFVSRRPRRAAAPTAAVPAARMKRVCETIRGAHDTFWPEHVACVTTSTPRATSAVWHMRADACRLDARRDRSPLAAPGTAT